MIRMEFLFEHINHFQLQEVRNQAKSLAKDAFERQIELKKITNIENSPEDESFVFAKFVMIAFYRLMSDLVSKSKESDLALPSNLLLNINIYYELYKTLDTVSNKPLTNMPKHEKVLPPFSKTTNRIVAEYFVTRGWVESIEDIYIELSPQQKQVREVLLKTTNKDEKSSNVGSDELLSPRLRRTK